MTNFWKGKTVLVTGAGGFVGSHFVEDLSLVGANVFGTSFVDLATLNYEFDNINGIQFIKTDLLDFDGFLSRVSDKGIDVIIHCAALDGNAEFKAKNSARIMDENSRIVSNVLNVAKRAGVRDVVLVSSAEIYAPQAASPVVEEDDYQKYFSGGGNGYVWAKIFSEALGKLYAEQFNMRVFFPRPTNIYGPRDKFDAQSNRAIPSMIYKVLHDKDVEIWGDGEQVRGFIYVKDLVYSILKMVESGKCQTMNIATSESISIINLAKLISKILKKEMHITLLPSKPVGVKERVLDNTKLQSILDATPKSLEEGLKETINWYLSKIHMEQNKIQDNTLAYDRDYMIERDYLPAHLLDSLQHFFRENNVKKILEVGVGSGKLMKALQGMGYQVEGIDLSPASAELAGVKVASATEIPFADDSFDCILGISIIEHLTKEGGIRFVNESRRVLKRNGVIFLVTPNLSSPLRYIQGKDWFGYSDKTHIFFYSPKTLKKLLRSSGFYSTRCTFKTSVSSLEWPLPSFVKKLAPFFRRLINYLLIRSPLAFYRDSFWISGKKKI